MNDERSLADGVRGTIKEETAAGLTVTARAPRFLEVVFDGLGGGEMDDEANVGFVNAVGSGGGEGGREGGEGDR